MSTERIEREVRLFTTARRQARFWDSQGFDQLAARLRLTARYCIRHARWIKKAEGPPHGSPAPAGSPQPEMEFTR
jgi:hypothetical protein